MIKAIKNTNVVLNQGSINTSEKYFSIKLEVLLDNGEQIPLYLKMPESSYGYLTSAITGDYDGPQNTDDHKAVFQAIASAIAFKPIHEPDCNHVRDNQGFCHMCGWPMGAS